MEKDNAELEATLGEFKPSPVPAALEARIFADASASKTFSKIIPFPRLKAFGSAAAVAVAAVGVFFAILNVTEPREKTGAAPLAGDAELLPTPARGTFRPVRAENVFEGAREEGFFFAADQTPVRKVRYQFSDSFLWENPDDGTLIEMTVPREKVFLVPVFTD